MTTAIKVSFKLASYNYLLSLLSLLTEWMTTLTRNNMHCSAN